jgi:hypothetical protein
MFCELRLCQGRFPSASASIVLLVVKKYGLFLTENAHRESYSLRKMAGDYNKKLQQTQQKM